MAKGKRIPSSAAPAPVRRASKTEPTARPCLFCNHADAVELDLLHTTLKPVPFFCTTICAASWAVTFTQASKMTFCVLHNCWSNLCGKCQACLDREAGYPVRLDLPSSREEAERQARAKEVDNG
jgi:hypothetical protein